MWSENKPVRSKLVAERLRGMGVRVTRDWNWGHTAAGWAVDLCERGRPILTFAGFVVIPDRPGSRRNLPSFM
jgi:hypothetical protein